MEGSAQFHRDLMKTDGRSRGSVGVLNGGNCGERAVNETTCLPVRWIDAHSKGTVSSLAVVVEKGRVYQPHADLQ